MKSHVWNLWGRKFVIDGSVTPTGRGVRVGEWEYRVHVQDGDEWKPVREDVAVGVLMSFLKRVDSTAKKGLFEERVPAKLREMIEVVKRQFGGRDAEANAYALCVVCLQRTGLLESGNLRMR